MSRYLEFQYIQALTVVGHIFLYRKSKHNCIMHEIYLDVLTMIALHMTIDCSQLSYTALSWSKPQVKIHFVSLSSWRKAEK